MVNDVRGRTSVCEQQGKRTVRCSSIGDKAGSFSLATKCRSEREQVLRSNAEPYLEIKA